MRKESYSSLSLFQNCPMSYKLRYIDKLYTKETAIALDIGNLTHYVLEQKYKPYNAISTDDLIQLFYNGGIVSQTDIQEDIDEDLKPLCLGDKIKGINDIKTEYFETYYDISKKSGLTYDNKIEIFIQRIKDSTNGIWNIDKEWNVLAVEFPFEIEYEDIKICGKIDRIDINQLGEMRIIDYKSSDSTYDDKKLQSPLQMFIYNLAVKEYFNQTPKEFMYDFILLGKQQKAMLNIKWEEKAKKELSKIITKLKECYNNNEFIPKPSPLCHWCVYSENTITIDKKLNDKCEYFSLWTPDNKVYYTNKKYEKLQDREQSEEEKFIW